jgi:LysR family glycine cleavage system transcriptional activator
VAERVPLPPLSAIRVFEAAARLKSFTRAGEELGMSQAAVSWQIKALEERLGTSMFRRLPREVVLTPAGERLAAAAGQAMNLLRTAIADLSETASGVLAITTLQTFAAQWLVWRMGAFQLAHPQIALRLDTSPRLVDLEHENFDLAIRAGPGKWPGLETVLLIPSVYTPLCAPELAQRIGGLEQPEQLLEAPLIGEPADWRAWFAEVGLGEAERRERFGFAADTQQFEVASALAGQGIALASPIFFHREIEAGRLVQPFEAVVAGPGDYWLAYPETRRRSPKIAAFRDWIVEAARSDPAVARYAK